jgi:hypothetical protein
MPLTNRAFCRKIEKNYMSDKPQYIELEAQVRAFWEKAGTFEQSVQKDAPNGEYVFYDGPPFATGTMHYGHMAGQIIKDVVPRFWTMRGYQVERKWGWDCHGLPIENLVEKELGITNKRQIIEMGVDKFNEACRSKVLSYVDDWKEMVARLGRFVDMENDYKTLDLSFMESVWWVFKQLYEKDLVYEGYRSMYICPRCETTLSQTEVADGYKDIKDLSVVAKFELADEPGTFLLAWTTSPWTLPGNVALAVNPELEYIKVKKDNEILILSKSEQDKKSHDVEVVGTLKGKELVGKSYKPLFDYYSSDEKLANRENGWKDAEKMTIEAMKKSGVPYKIVHEGAAFYGPKMDFQIKSSIGRTFTASTNQLDLYMGKRFGLEYIDKDGQKKTPAVIHRAPLGTHERFIGFLIEHFAGAFPLWLAPTQIIILPISKKQNKYAASVEKELKGLNPDLRIEIDDRDESVGKKIREASMQKSPYMLILGEKEMKAKKIAVRGRGEKDYGVIPVKKFAQMIGEEIEKKK